jgi:hypothetical protein
MPLRKTPNPTIFKFQSVNNSKKADITATFFMPLKSSGIIFWKNTQRSAIAQSVQLLLTGWTVRGSNPGGGEIFCTRPDRPWGPPSHLYNGCRVFPSSAEVKESVELYLYSPSGTSRSVVGWNLRSALMVLSKDGFVLGGEICNTDKWWLYQHI